MPEEKPEEMIEQFQIYQQQLQSVLIQKENLKMQNLEIERALEELNKTDQKTAYKIAGQIMVSKPVEELKKDLSEMKETVEVRIKGLEKTEERMVNKLKELQDKLKDVIKE
jgi:prefoldin beta subunit